MKIFTAHKYAEFHMRDLVQNHLKEIYNGSIFHDSLISRLDEDIIIADYGMLCFTGFDMLPMRLYDEIIDSPELINLRYLAKRKLLIHLKRGYELSFVSLLNLLSTFHPDHEILTHKKIINFMREYGSYV